VAPQPRAACKGPCPAHRPGATAGVTPQSRAARRGPCPANRPGAAKI